MSRSAGSTPQAGDLPNLLIIGAAKSGTTSLHEYLDLHPEIFMSRPKELRLFSQDEWLDYVGWYREHFTDPLPVRGESSPAYTMHPWFSDVPSRASQLVPDARLIYLVRDPIDRLVAQYVEHVSMLGEERSLTDALADYCSPQNRFVMASRYALQLDRWRDHYPDDRILVLNHTDLLKRRSETLTRVLDFLGVDSSFTSPAFEHLHNSRGGKWRTNTRGIWLHERGLLRRGRSASRVLPTAMRERLKPLVADPVATPVLAADLRDQLTSHLADDVARLRALSGQAFPDWSI